jgi:hypothetical protein
MHDRLAHFERHAATTVDCLQKVEVWMLDIDKVDIDKGQTQLLNALRERQMQLLVRDVVLLVLQAVGVAFVGYNMFDEGAGWNGLERQERNWYGRQGDVKGWR